MAQNFLKKNLRRIDIVDYNFDLKRLRRVERFSFHRFTLYGGGNITYVPWSVDYFILGYSRIKIFIFNKKIDERFYRSSEVSALLTRCSARCVQSFDDVSLVLQFA